MPEEPRAVRALAATAMAGATEIGSAEMPRTYKGDIAEDELVRAFAESQVPQAILYMPNGCYTLAVNQHHWRTFGSQLPTPETAAITELIRHARQPLPGALSHCKQIHAIDALRRSQCTLEIAYDQLKPRKSAKSLEFVRIQTTDDARVYQVWVITAFLVYPQNPHVMLVRLTPVHGVTVHVLTLDATAHQCVTKTSVHRAGKLWLPYAEMTVNEQEAPEYFQMDQELERAENHCTSAHARHLLQLLRDTASQYEHPAQYQQRLLLEALVRGAPSAAGLAHKIHCLRKRLFDAFPVVDHVRVALIRHLEDDNQLKDDDSPADAKSVDEMQEYWEFDEPQYEAALQERAVQEQKAAQYRLIFLEQPTRAIVTQLATGGPQTLEQLASQRQNPETPLSALVKERVVSEDRGRYQLTATASAILNTAWGQAMRDQTNGSPRP